MVDLMCMEDLTDEMSYTVSSPDFSPEYVPQHSSVSPVLSTPVSKEDALDTFYAWRGTGSKIPVNNYSSPEFNTSLTAWVMYLHTYLKSTGMNTTTPVHHTVNIFLRYINVPEVYSEYASKTPPEQWQALTWYRLACLWIALKFENQYFDDVDSIIPEDTPRANMDYSRKVLKICEVEVLSALGFAVGAPKDFISIMGVITGIHADILERAQEVLVKFACFPDRCVETPHELVCAGAIISAWESMGGDRKLLMGNPQSYVNQLEHLEVGCLQELYTVADTILGALNELGCSY